METVRRTEEVTEEIELIRSTFSDLVRVLKDGRIHAQFPMDIEVIFTLSDGYPTRSPPQHKILVPAYLSGVKSEIERKLIENYVLLLGCPLLSICISDVESIVRRTAAEKNETNGSIRIPDLTAETSSNDREAANRVDSEFNWRSGPILEDRKSVFQGHLVEVRSRDEVTAALSELKENSKIARATHNIYAYVIVRSDDVEITDCEDDGEKGAGSKLLQMIRLMKVENLLIVVSRWYGGIHLSTDRFRHICNVARALIVEHRTELMTESGRAGRSRR